MSELASSYKVACHTSKIDSYLRGEAIYPVSLELDLTAQCNRNCPECPSSKSSADMSLTLDFVERLMRSLAGETKGLLLTGGEPTLYPEFPAVLAMARRLGFKDIAVVTNGTYLDEPSVMGALLEHASTIRVSMYEWGADSCQGMNPTLERIERLRKKIDTSGSSLQIGTSALTCSDNATALNEVALKVCSAGAHWLYFHPVCVGWGSGAPVKVPQDGVVESIQSDVTKQDNGFSVYWLKDRYTDEELSFASYYSAYFLLIIGADGKNYLAPEVKYQPRYAIADVLGTGCGNFLWQPSRLDFIAKTASHCYPPLKSKNRGILYSHLIDQLCQGSVPHKEACKRLGLSDFRFPHIL
ncbi:MAG TPA: radical SAM protein [Candidatus Hydrogenedentes bacterium]|nr:radical SAM protein [Candidatus Hydrogenedentota bacterium]